MQDTQTIHQITLPRLSNTDEESLITFWYKSKGDYVKKGDVLVEVQTEKAVSEIESDTDGVIVKIHKKRGEVAAVGEVLASIASGDGSARQIGNQNLTQDTFPSVQQELPVNTSFVKASPRVRKLAKDLGVDLAATPGTGKNGEPTVEDIQIAVKRRAADMSEKEAQDETNEALSEVASNCNFTETSTEDRENQKPRIIATPSVRKLAREKGVNLEELQGEVNGKIQREDVLRFAEERGQDKGETADPETSPETHEAVEVVRFAGARKAIAKAMTHSKQTIPHVTHFAEPDVTELVIHRERFKEEARSRNIKLTFLPYVVKALIGALKECKELNASIDDNEENILYKKYYNIGIAVQTENGLVVPVIKNADQKTVTMLAKEIESLTAAAREGKLTADQMRGGTCTISNIGSVGGQWFTPVINHPETSILGIGEIFEKPSVRNGEIAIGKLLPLSLSYDHRVIDGVIAQNALNHIKKLLQDPELLLLELD
ncbi:2-oxo acid dehydrogenase subunit E2 [Bacillus sp. T33-2]|uniref:2-oxo acid dehydrogenase subunit E2 n=1 Tax=Bacillus sp. T33-2 TaxID=2054168 RepID=UPI000C790CC4|nr:2-oxo acid dehydrogenase subunit E2 [Bacillus sp. T33-2]PLR96903.1 dihydrolipoyllysine acetyltransferase [Bacillus sp. T33-2]